MRFKQLNEIVFDEYIPDKKIRHNLKLSEIVPDSPVPVPKSYTLDLHNKTVEESWELICKLLDSGVKRAVVITGASGVLKPLFINWCNESIISHRIYNVKPLNNGSFSIGIRVKS